MPNALGSLRNSFQWNHHLPRHFAVENPGIISSNLQLDHLSASSLSDVAGLDLGVFSCNTEGDKLVVNRQTQLIISRAGGSIFAPDFVNFVSGYFDLVS